jgi:hypothetical protein
MRIMVTNKATVKLKNPDTIIYSSNLIEKIPAGSKADAMA